MHLHALASLALLAAIACVMPACAADTGPDDESATDEDDLSSQGIAKWQAYVARTTRGVKLQAGCEPVRVAPRTGAPKRGVVVLFHGFSACPQQYLDVSRTLAAGGWEVLLPLSPGHGRAPLSRTATDAQDDFSDLPTSETKQRYVDFVREMNEIVADAGGERVVGGLSLGGALAARAVAEASQGTYARALLMSPFFGIPGTAGWLSKAANVIVPGRDAGWGDGCEQERAATPPRAGICDFQVRHLRGAADFAEDTARLTSRISGTRVQIIGVEGDGAADNAATRRVSDTIRAGLCFYPKGVPHSFLSRFDNPNETKYWLRAAEAHVTGFLMAGTPVPTGARSSEGTALTCKL